MKEELKRKKIKATKAKYYIKHREEIKTKTAKYQRDHVDTSNSSKEKWLREHPDKHKESVSKWQNNNRDKVNAIQAKWQKSQRGKLICAKHTDKRNRELGSELLNDWFEGCNRHHVTAQQIICIPKDMHTMCRHNHKKPDTMNRINILAWDYMEISCI